MYWIVRAEKKGQGIKKLVNLILALSLIIVI